MGGEDEALLGFSWRSGSTRDTTGIIMWNDVFLHEVPTTGEKLAIIVMDTQGLFDNETSPMDNSRIFALGTLISSIQVLNLSGVVQEDQLQYLQFATEFAKFATADSQGTSGKPFQNLLFLIRDWTNPDEYPFGSEGGSEYMKYFLKIKPNQKEELRSVRQFIQSSFEELSCSLLPHPGSVIAGGKRLKVPYNGSWGKMDDDFKEELEKLIQHLLEPDRLVIKKINNKDLKGVEFKEYIDQYFKLFQSEDLPQAQSIYESTVEKQMNLLINQCYDNYKEIIFKNQDMIVTKEQIPIFHAMAKNQALLLYKETKKMGNAKHHEKFQKDFEDMMEKAYVQWSDRSEKNLKQIQEEKEKTRLALEEKERLYRQQLEDEKKAAEKIAELDRLNAQKEIEKAKYLKEKEIAEFRLKAEEDKRKALENDKKREEEFRRQMQAQLETMQALANRPVVVSGGGGGCNIL
ncbi:hypothetical protein PVAND_016412 [Polypedilum vanderplanki]|uniref:GB1/RHD3-type G domain-containing protein n=1 Tax=Polypedilum vanderplanki TaxID=319348 RepID=A0A9J6BF12_POLVA|nr:hypothetical protein PVAND_016412 [Polypedilum vanderplanki]